MTFDKSLYRKLGQLCLGLLLIHSPLLPAQSAPVQEVDHIVAIVDDDVVVNSELYREIRNVVLQFRENKMQLPPREIVEKQVLERLILKKLQLAAAKRAGIGISEDLVAQAVNNVARNNKLSLSEFRRALQDGGISFDAFREDIRDQLTIQRLKEQEIARRIRVTDQEIETFLARQASSVGARSDYRLFHILIATPEGGSPEQLSAVREKAERILADLRAGADFQTTALTESDGRQALEGGDLGWRSANQLPTVFVDEVINLERGEISNLIRTSSGYHIVKLEDYKGGERQIITQTHARHILVATSEVTSNEAARVRLEQLRIRIIGGDDFSALARSHSDDKSSALNGGDLGWITPGAMLPAFEQEMEKLAPGDISQPFNTDFGWHLVQVLERRQHDSTSEVQKAEARKAIRNRKLGEEGELYLRRLRDEAYVEIRLDNR